MCEEVWGEGVPSTFASVTWERTELSVRVDTAVAMRSFSSLILVPNRHSGCTGYQYIRLKHQIIKIVSILTILSVFRYFKYQASPFMDIHSLFCWVEFRYVQISVLNGIKDKFDSRLSFNTRFSATVS